jgi:SAM-dependent methyltransferase
MPCKLCGNTVNNTPYRVREMMLGTRDTFDYFQCGECLCLQITNVPNNMNKYYPKTYYSFGGVEENKTNNTLKKIYNKLIKFRDMYAITNKGLVGYVLYKLRPFTELRTLAQYNITKTTSILDIGCGTGHYLYKFKEYGFTNLLGVDPFINETINYKNGLTIKKTNISEIDGSWDVIMLHHSLEHMENQVETLKKITSLLKDNGICLIRIPTVSSDLWETYKENWVHLDAPRHFFLHSHKSLKLVAEKAGLLVESITSDANAFSFYGSEFYLQNIPSTKWTEEAFTKKERRIFKKRAEEINKSGRGDNIAVILRKK